MLMGIWHQLQSLRAKRHLLAFTIIYAIFVWIVISQSLVMVHNSPLNKYGDFSDLKKSSGSNATAKLQNFSNTSNAEFGLTYGEPTAPIFDQIAKPPLVGDFIPGFLSLPIIVSVLLYLVLIGVVIWLIHSRITHSPTQFTTIVLAGTILFFLHISLLFQLDSMIQYISSSNEPMAVFSARSNIPDIFYLLIFLQGVIISSLAAVWTRPLLPNEPHNAKFIQLHTENWRKYGSWIATLFGGVFLTTAIVFITDLSSVGRHFLRHALVLFGGGLVLHLGFITYKITKLEQKFSDLLKRRQKSTLLIRRH